MAQEPFGDAHGQQQPWYPQGPQPDWQGYYDPQQAHVQAHVQTHAEAQQPPAQPQWQQATQYDQQQYDQQQYDPYYGQTGYVEGGYAQAPGQGHDPYGGGQQYPQPYPDQHGGQPYAAQPPQAQPVADALYVPAGAEYSADGYVRIEQTEEPAAEPGPTAAETVDRPGGGSGGEPAGPAPRSRAARRGGSGSGSGSAALAPSGSLVDRVRAAVLTGEHVPSRRALLVRAGAGVAALGVLITAALTVGAEGGGSAAATSGGEPGFAVAHTKVWSAQPATSQPAAASPAGDDTLVGSWLLADAVVRADGSGVHAYDRTAGKPTWSVEPPAAGAVPCGLSSGVNQAGLGAALFRPQADPKSPCTLVAAVDTKTGKTVWTKNLSDAKGPYSARVGVTDDMVIAVGDDHALAWAAADGKDVWQYTGQGKFCTLSGGVSGKTVLVASSCADSTPADQAVSLNAADGKVGWWRGLNNQPKTVTVLSAEPAVVLTTGGKPEDDRVFAWGATGDPAAEIPVVTDAGRLDVGHGTFSATPEVFFEGRTMVAAMSPAKAGGPVSAVGYDLDTGKQRWRTPTSAKGGARAVGIDGGSLVLAADERRDQPARLGRFPLAGGQEAVGGNFPAGTGSLLLSGRVLIGGGQVVVVPEHASNYGTAAGYQAKG
ncbi:PQQ-binding-like beta-propeller repeat protein [Kitasatospora sp. NPDC089509]|uniref:outer membrane protein assembly factor BamB family protein n=1 Tax=Kitasatospora sp. NPDC089509 TaxID=3364079 RepID=UPI0038007027